MSATMRMTVLEACAHHGSVSYRKISAARLRDILLGAEPAQGELASVEQALTEMPAARGYDLAVEIGMTHVALDARTRDLCNGQGLLQ